MGEGRDLHAGWARGGTCMPDGIYHARAVLSRHPAATSMLSSELQVRLQTIMPASKLKTSAAPKRSLMLEASCAPRHAPCMAPSRSRPLTRASVCRACVDQTAMRLSLPDAMSGRMRTLRWSDIATARDRRIPGHTKYEWYIGVSLPTYACPRDMQACVLDMMCLHVTCLT